MLTPPPITANLRTRRLIWVCRRGGSVSSELSDWPILPISLIGPVARTSAIPAPRTTSDPEKTFGELSPPGRAPRPGSPKPATLRTGTDSPVRNDSSTCRSSHSTSAASAGTRSPSESTTMSPRATSRPGIRLRSPSRMTSARGLVRSRERLENALGARLLNHRDHDGEVGEDKQDQGLVPVAERKIDGPAGEEQRDHRLAHHLEDDFERSSAVGAGEFVVSFSLQPRLSFGFPEALLPARRRRDFLHARLHSTGSPSSMMRPDLRSLSRRASSVG